MPALVACCECIQKCTWLWLVQSLGAVGNCRRVLTPWDHCIVGLPSRSSSWSSTAPRQAAGSATSTMVCQLLVVSAANALRPLKAAKASRVVNLIEEVLCGLKVRLYREATWLLWAESEALPGGDMAAVG